MASVEASAERGRGVRLATMALSGLVVIALSACSGGGSKNVTTSPTTSPGTSPTTAATQQPVTTVASTTGSSAPAATGGSATFNPQGCAAPSAAAIGTAFGA